jgi:hypothetical protein
MSAIFSWERAMIPVPLPVMELSRYIIYRTKWESYLVTASLFPASIRS